MKIFSFAQFALLEGGKALEQVRRILKKEIPATVADVEAKLFPVIGTKDFKMMGSAGHKPDSGDIDFGLRDVDVDEDLADKVKSKFPDNEVKFMKGLEVLSISWPIEGDEKKGMVQVDVIPIKNEAWTDFVYKFPAGSKYSSSHRNWLLAAIVAVMRESEEKDDSGNVVSYVGHMFKLNDGLFKVEKTYQGKTKLLKSSKKIDEKKITDDPAAFVKMLFGDKFNPKDVVTVEQCINIMKGPDFRWKSRIKDIKDYYSKFLERVGLEYPREL
jgi:hypothetical protein